MEVKFSLYCWLILVLLCGQERSVSLSNHVLDWIKDVITLRYEKTMIFIKALPSWKVYALSVSLNTWKNSDLIHEAVWRKNIEV